MSDSNQARGLLVSAGGLPAAHCRLGHTREAVIPIRPTIDDFALTNSEVDRQPSTVQCISIAGTRHPSVAALAGGTLDGHLPLTNSCLPAQLGSPSSIAVISDVGATEVERFPGLRVLLGKWHRGGTPPLSDLNALINRRNSVRGRVPIGADRDPSVCQFPMPFQQIGRLRAGSHFGAYSHQASAGAAMLLDAVFDTCRSEPLDEVQTDAQQKGWFQSEGDGLRRSEERVLNRVRLRLRAPRRGTAHR